MRRFRKLYDYNTKARALDFKDIYMFNFSFSVANANILYIFSFFFNFLENFWKIRKIIGCMCI